MKTFAVVAALLQVAVSSHVAVRLPYLNPAGVNYVGGVSAHGAPLVSAPGPNLEYQHGEAALQYAQQPHGLEYEHHHQGLEYAQHSHGLEYAQYPQAQLQYTAHAPAHVEAHHVGYATAQVPAVAAVPVVKHVPALAEVPVTKIEAQHGFIEKQVDVAKPAVATKKFQVRRPAIQKHFYDIEEHVVVRPAGTALVELAEPLSKVQKGPTVVQALEHAAPLSVSAVADEHHHHHHQEHHLDAHSHGTIHVTPTPGFVHATPTPVYAHEAVHVTPAPVLVSSPSPSPVFVSSTVAPHYEESDSVIVENANFRNSVASLKQKERQIEDLEHQQDILKAEINAERSAQAHSAHSGVHHGIVTHSNGSPLEEHVAHLAAHEAGPSVVPSVKSSPAEAHANQHKLIELLTARGGVAEVGFGREGPASYVGDAGHVHARVLSATPSPDYAHPTGERVSTRRVVVSRPIETLQEFDVVEPATKIERVSYQQPTVIKTARTHHVKVQTSVPVYGKALAPAVAHASVPVFQKTVTPAAEYGYYH
ncbi:uncharacterized protein LOC124414635 [Diprion similis]|uniref:uncharacterized protein LOC124414635 n=1 Tax=Diprion similis TaxID=362088 RepID=UPI001EF9193D|nr:uncharacterized protein LOC124414635 [Diprion similis]